MASREHARIHVMRADGASSVLVEDVGSANGTRVRDRPIPSRHRIPLTPGDTVTIGSTVVIVVKGEPPVSARRVWSRGYLEHRVTEECARGRGTTASLALVRIRFARGVAWTGAVPIVARWLPPPHVFATCGPHDYDALLVDVDHDEALQMAARVVTACRTAGLDVQVAVAHYPRDGRSLQELLACLDAMAPGPFDDGTERS